MLSDHERREKQQKNIAKAKLKMYVKDYLERLDRRILIGRRDSQCKSLISFFYQFLTQTVTVATQIMMGTQGVRRDEKIRVRLGNIRFIRICKFLDQKTFSLSNCGDIILQECKLYCKISIFSLTP